MSLTISQESN